MSQQLFLDGTTCGHCHTEPHAGFEVKMLIVTLKQGVLALCRCRICDHVGTYELDRVEVKL